MFQVGQRVVCVNDEFPFEIKAAAAAFEMTLPKKGVVYTVRGIADGSMGQSIVLEEIVNPPLRWLTGFGELYFVSTRFRIPASAESEQFAEELIKSLERDFSELDLIERLNDLEEKSKQLIKK